ALARPVLEIQDLKVRFRLEKNWFDRFIAGSNARFVHAVDGVDLRVRRGEVVGLVGESGSGKSTLGMAIIALVEILQGKILFRNQDITNLLRKDRRQVLRHIQMIFQNPYSSLNPAMRVRSIIGRQFKISESDYRDDTASEKINSILRDVGLRAEDGEKYPHEFSGGQKQRISLARALATNPEFIIADEITSALDVSIQSQILSLLLQIKEKTDLSMIYITHDLRVARLITDSVAVMYLGRIVEYGRTSAIFENPLHPYTLALLSAIPGNRIKNPVSLTGNIPSAVLLPPGCRLYGRCPHRMDVCKLKYPAPRKVEGRTVACHLYPAESTDDIEAGEPIGSTRSAGLSAGRVER
ncbi:MAG: ABC transporter ATP-binding protein, partial [Albidovulum sp.]|nr:ABC transporter ATP-binding protein [Albidovulum sp.]